MTPYWLRIGKMKFVASPISWHPDNIIEERMQEVQNNRGSYNRYSVAFKMQVVEEVENGLISAEQARKLFRIPGKATIAEWIEKYSINQRINKAVYVMTHEEELEVIRLRKVNNNMEYNNGFRRSKFPTG